MGIGHQVAAFGGCSVGIDVVGELSVLVAVDVEVAVHPTACEVELHLHVLTCLDKKRLGHILVVEFVASGQCPGCSGHRYAV